jgi:hypothetical protein
MMMKVDDEETKLCITLKLIEREEQEEKMFLLGVEEGKQKKTGFNLRFLLEKLYLG